MALKTYNPTSPSRRSLVLVDKSDIYKGKPVKKLTKGLTKSGGRNNAGRITVWWKGGCHKRSYRIIDFKRQKDNMNAEVIRIEYDPNRSCHIALIKYEDGTLNYVLAFDILPNSHFWHIYLQHSRLNEKVFPNC